ncbi:acetoacetate decarboxylase family protein [Nocardioides kribbensis]|uniref:Acetoacetate decarboxylase family protein n=1 Tax=Nocardioides kribbensis TaxID=305517 RepID=A0ABV1NWE7_9ACTN
MSAAEPAGAYPPEPWDLTGTGRLTAWAVPVGDLPALPAGVRPVVLRGRALAATAFVRYDERGLMAYDELLAAVVVRHGRGLALSITDIWVDSEVSRAGGRGLWGIPKELATFSSPAADRLGARTDDGPLASVETAPRRLPGLRLPLPLRSHVVQTRDGATVASPIRATGRVRPARARWTVEPEGALAWLRGASPVTSAVAEDFAMRFGAAAEPASGR